jgi:hypothetical protein
MCTQWHIKHTCGCEKDSEYVQCAERIGANVKCKPVRRLKEEGFGSYVQDPHDEILEPTRCIVRSTKQISLQDDAGQVLPMRVENVCLEQEQAETLIYYSRREHNHFPSIQPNLEMQ